MWYVCVVSYAVEAILTEVEILDKKQSPNGIYITSFPFYGL